MAIYRLRVRQSSEYILTRWKYLSSSGLALPKREQAHNSFSQQVLSEGTKENEGRKEEKKGEKEGVH